MTAPKVDTIRRYADNGLCIEILRERGILTESEAKAFHQRDRQRRDVSYARTYSDAVVEYRTRHGDHGLTWAGEVFLPAKSEPDWTGKREYLTTTGERVYLFDDEILDT